MNTILRTDIIPILDEKGTTLSTITLKEPITPALMRRGGYADNGTYYKGAGIVYHGHLTNRPASDEKILKENPLPYQRFSVVKPHLLKKFGIFTFPHQPIFRDCEGGCGPKERKLPSYVKEFSYSAISEITDIIAVPLTDHFIYAYRLIDVPARPLDTLKLFEYILVHHYNSAWDKNLWADVYNYCYVRDLADWFHSTKFQHKLGTIYALLSSIYKQDKYLYHSLTSALFGYHQYDQIFIPFLSAWIVEKFSPESVREVSYDFHSFTPAVYEALLTDLYSGNACCHLEEDETWAFIREEYKKKIPLQVSLFGRELQLLGRL